MSAYGYKIIMIQIMSAALSTFALREESMSGMAESGVSLHMGLPILRRPDSLLLLKGLGKLKDVGKSDGIGDG